MPKKPKPPDPDRLVRDQPGVYRSEDGRFTVRSDAAGAWYVSDAERSNELGLDLVFGPLATLAEAKDAVRRQREEPTGQTADQSAELAATARAVAPHMAKADRRPRGRSTVEPEAPIQPEPLTEAEPPMPAVHRARRRRTGDARDDVVDTLRRINDAWLQRKVDEMASALDDRVVFVQPEFGGRVEGRERAIQSYREFLASATILEFSESELSADVWGDSAVATYRYALDWEADGDRHHDEGHDLFVFRRSRDMWLAVFRLQTQEGARN
jgi:hypothetical protein